MEPDDPWEDIFHPDTTSSGDEEESEDEDEKVAMNGKVLVDEDKLMSLFNFCQVCGEGILDSNVHRYYVGAQLNVKWQCNGGHKDIWKSSPDVRGMPEVNLQAAASVLFTGGTFTELSEWCKEMKLHMFGKTTFHGIQKAYLHPAIEELYQEQRLALLARVYLKQTADHDDPCPPQPPQLLGDARCDSPGFSSKYCHYSFMLDDTKEILHTELLQVIMMILNVVFTAGSP